MKKEHRVYVIGSAILITAVIFSLVGSDIQDLFATNSQEQPTISEDAKLNEPKIQSITGTLADNYPEDERETHCGTPTPKSNKYIKEYEIPTLCTQPVGIVVDDDNKIWFTETNAGNVGMFDPQTEQFIEYENKLWPKGTNSMMWGILLTDDDEIWFTDENHDSLWRFSIDEKKYFVYTFSGNHTMKFPQKIIPDGKNFLINDFTGNKISVIDHNELHSNATLPAQITTPAGFFTGPPALDNNGYLWFFAWKYQAQTSLIKFDKNNDKATMLDFTGIILAPNGLSIDDENNLWISDTASSNFIKFDSESKQIIKYVTSFPREITYGNASGLIKTPISRPYWNAIYDDQLIFNEQQANTIGVFDLNTEKLIEYLIPSRNPKWADCGDQTDCGVSQAFGFSKSGTNIWYTTWVENSIGVIDLSIPLPLEIQFDTKDISVKPGGSHILTLSVTLNEDHPEFNVISATAEKDAIHVYAQNRKTNDNTVDIPVEISVSDDIEPGVYKVLIGVAPDDVTVSQFITVKVL